MSDGTGHDAGAAGPGRDSGYCLDIWFAWVAAGFVLTIGGAAMVGMSSVSVWSELNHGAPAAGQGASVSVPWGQALALVSVTGGFLVLLHIFARREKMPLRVLGPAPALAWWLCIAGWSALGFVVPMLGPTTPQLSELMQNRQGAQGLTSAIQAGVTEEALYVVTIVGAGVFWAELSQRFRRIPGWVAPTMIGVCVVLSGLVRGGDHIYQSWVYATGHAVLGLVLAGVFVWCRSIWPLLMVHVVYDALVFAIPSEVNRLFRMGSA